MNDRTKIAVSGSIIVLALMLSVPPAHAASRCEQPTVGGEARACAAEREGADALRRFVTRTRMIYGLYFFDLRREEPATASTARSSQIAAVRSRAP